MAECPPILVPETQNCSGRGVCLSATECSCPDGWTGAGDFAFHSPSCAINIPAIQALWAIVALLHFGNIWFSIYLLNIKRKQKSRTIAPLFLASVIFICSVSFFITGIGRASNPVRTIGSDAFVTTFFCFGSAAFWSAVHIFIYAFIDLSLRQSRLGRQENEETKKVRMHLKISLPISNIVSVTACVLPFGMLGATNAVSVQQLATGHYVILAGELFFTGIFLTPHFIRKVVVDIEDAVAKNPSKSTLLTQIVAKLKRFRTELRNQAMSNILFAALFGFWPYLQVYGSSYFLPFAWTSGAILNALGLYVNLPVNEKKSSNSGTGDKTSSVQPTGTAPSGPNTNGFTVMPPSYFEGASFSGGGGQLDNAITQFDQEEEVTQFNPDVDV